ncbi:hypothetical protein SEUCBS140593_003475 [Sporothrix eucalyptigena]|uniref:Major facilitator superfamily (MFS) profile domain-containing protein n=1 Tax=Sporothrix eucalyptigena TaxID=1812306 RepID=A0ABP0BF49_9PEZI
MADEKTMGNQVEYAVEAAPVEDVVSPPHHNETGPLDPAVNTGTTEFNIASAAIGTDNLPPGYFYSLRFLATMVAVTLMNVSLYVGYVLPINVLTIINTDIGPSANIVLVPIVKTLGQGVVVLLVGRLGDIFGRRWFVIGGQTAGVIGAIMAATSKNINTLLGSTAFIGIAGAVQLSFSIVIQELVPYKHRGYVMAIQFIMSFPFGCFGPVMARSLVVHTSLSWRWCYYMNLITCGLSVVLFVVFYHPPSYGLLHQGSSMRRELRRLDYLGVLLYVGGLLMLMLGITWGGSVHPWSSSYVIGTIAGGLVTIIIFAVYETWHPFSNVHALVPVKILKNRNYLALLFSTSVATMIYNSMNVLWPKLVQTLFTTDTMLIGWYSIALGGSVAFGQIVSGIMVRPFGRPLKLHWQIRLGCAGMCAFMAAMAAITVNRGALAIALMALSAFSLGFVELLAIVMVPLTCSADDIGLACGFQISCRNVLGTIATAIYSTVYANRNLVNISIQVRQAAEAAGLAASAIPQAIVAAETGTAAAYAKVPGMTASIESALMKATAVAQAQSFRTMFLISLAFGLTSVFASFFITDMDHLLTSHVSRKLLTSSDEKLARTEGGSKDIEQ